MSGHFKYSRTNAIQAGSFIWVKPVYEHCWVVICGTVKDMCDGTLLLIYSFNFLKSGVSTGSLCVLKWSQTDAKYSLSLHAICRESENVSSSI